MFSTEHSKNQSVRCEREFGGFTMKNKQTEEI